MKHDESPKKSPCPPSTPKKVLLTSICRPLGRKHGDAPSVGYELLFGQVTRAQGLFSPRANHVQFSLEYIAENLEAPTTVLQYPTRRELIRELKRGYDYVGISFVLATFHRAREVVALIRKFAPGTEIILGGYGTVLRDEVLTPYADHVCREEGVRFMRHLLGEPDIPMPYGHPLIVSRLRVFGQEVSRTGMVFAGLGCPNGCDFCCTSHFFKRRHIRLLPTGRDIYRVIERYHEVEPGMSIVILDEDFLLNKKRALEFRSCVLSGGRPLSIFAFASVRAISQYTMLELLEMGIDGLWVGYEGSQSGFAKQTGRPIDELLTDCREHGISILASMIIGLPYQTPKIIREELSGLLTLKPDLTQFLIYGPTPGTPFFERIMEQGLLHGELQEDPELYYRKCSGFAPMVTHPKMRPNELEEAQSQCFAADYRTLGPSIYRSIETWLLGYLKLKDLSNPILNLKAEHLSAEIRKVYPAFLAGRILGPTREVRRWIADLETRIHGLFGRPTLHERLLSVVAVGLAAWTGLTLKLGWFQHPRLTRRTFRFPENSRISPAWRNLGNQETDTHEVDVELRPESVVWVQVKGSLVLTAAEHLVANLREALRRTEHRLILDFRRLIETEPRVAKRIADGLSGYRDRIRILLPLSGELAVLSAIYPPYK